MRFRVKVFCGFALVAAVLTANCWRSDAQEKAGDAALIKRGAYLVNDVANCGDCHTPRNAKGELDKTMHLQGAPTWFTSTIKFKKWDKSAPDLTTSGRGGKWSEEKLVKFLSTGERANMPMPTYNMTVDDAKAVVAYMKSLPPKK